MCVFFTPRLAIFTAMGHPPAWRPSCTFSFDEPKTDYQWFPPLRGNVIFLVSDSDIYGFESTPLGIPTHKGQGHISGVGFRYQGDYVLKQASKKSLKEKKRVGEKAMQSFFMNPKYIFWCEGIQFLTHAPHKYEKKTFENQDRLPWRGISECVAGHFLIPLHN